MYPDICVSQCVLNINYFNYQFIALIQRIFNIINLLMTPILFLKLFKYLMVMTEYIALVPISTIDCNKHNQIHCFYQKSLIEWLIALLFKFFVCSKIGLKNTKCYHYIDFKQNLNTNCYLHF